jgi:hypothetical protein
MSDERITTSITIDERKIVYELWETSAPSDYDGFGTFTIAANVGTDSRGRKTRVVLIEVENVDWQTSRYASGLCLVEPKTEYPDSLRAWATEKLWHKLRAAEPECSSCAEPVAVHV